MEDNMSLGKITAIALGIGITGSLLMPWSLWFLLLIVAGFTYQFIGSIHLCCKESPGSEDQAVARRIEQVFMPWRRNSNIAFEKWFEEEKRKLRESRNKFASFLYKRKCAEDETIFNEFRRSNGSAGN